MERVNLGDGFENANGIVRGFYVRSICKDHDEGLYLCFRDLSGSIHGAVVMGDVTIVELRTDDLRDFEPAFTFIDLWVKKVDGRYDVYVVFSSFELRVECGVRPAWVHAPELDMGSLVALLGS
jgi:hypothetical protein